MTAQHAQSVLDVPQQKPLHEAEHRPIPISEILEHVMNLRDYIPQQTVRALEGFTNEQWLPVMLNRMNYFHPWEGLNHGYVAPIIRVDMTAIPYGATVKHVEQLIFEIETRPDGLHAMLACASLLNNSESLLPGVENLITEKEKLLLTRALSNCEGFLTMNPEIEGDQNLADLLGITFSTNLEDFRKTTGNWWIRVPHPTEAQLSVAEYDELAVRSVVPIADDSRKDYLIHLGLAESLANIVPEHINYTNGLCVKPVFATRSNGVVVLRPQAPKDQVVDTVKRIDDIYRNGEEAEYLIMPYILPVERNDVPGREGQPFEVIWRLFLVWDPSVMQYKYLAGITTANPKGAAAQAIFGSRTDAVFWPVATNE